MNYHIKRLMGSIIYLAAIGFLIIKVEQLNRYYQNIYSYNFQPPYLWILFVMIGFPALVGSLLALPQLVKTARQDGAWKVEAPSSSLSLPGLCFVLTYIICILVLN